MHIKYFTILIVGYCLILSGCKDNNNDIKIYKDSSGNITEVFISDSKTRDLGINFGNAINKELITQIFSEGVIIIPPEYIKNVTAPLEGEIIKISCSKGSAIKSGSTLAYIENADFIELQQQYLDARNQYNYYKEEYTRQGELTIESATSVKKMQIARRDFQSAELKYNTTSLQLKTMGINPLSLENNNIIAFIPVSTNQPGKISNIFIQPGDFVKKGQLLFEIIKDNNLSVKLFISEQHYTSIHIGQAVDCYVASDSLTSYYAEISEISQKIDPKSHQFEVKAEFETLNPDIIRGMSVKAKISDVRDSACLIKKSSILQTTEGNYVFLKNNGKFIKYPVITGITVDNITQIVAIPQNLQDSVVISGLKRLNALFNNR